MGDRQFRTYDTSALQPKRSKGPMIAFVAVIVVIALLLILGVSTLVRGCTSGNLAADGQQVTVEVADGESTSSIAQSLQQAGLVSSAGDFTKKVSDLGLDGSLQPGTYTLTGGMSLEDLAKTLSAGPGLSGPSVTIPEGLTLANIAGRVSDATNGRISADDFKAQASNASVYASDFPFLKDAGTNSLEGFLFPKTYAVSSTDTADSLIRAMLSQYQTEVATLDYSYPTSKNFNSYQTLILASIIDPCEGVGGLLQPFAEHRCADVRPSGLGRHDRLRDRRRSRQLRLDHRQRLQHAPPCRSAPDAHLLPEHW